MFHYHNSDEDLANMTSRLEISLNIPECDDFAGLVKYTYFDFCLAMDYINQGTYVSRAKTEEIYANLLGKFYKALEGERYQQGAFALNRAIFGMAGGVESDLEKYWSVKADDCGKPREQANQSMLKELATSLLETPEELDLEFANFGVELPKVPKGLLPDDELSGLKLPKSVQKLILAKIKSQPKRSEEDQLAEFLALRAESMAKNHGS